MNSELQITLDEVLPRLSQSLQRKLLHSVELLRKAEKLAFSYDSDNGFYLAFSGGKDSQCLYHVAKLAGVKFKAHMNLTSVDPPEVIHFVKAQYSDVELIKPNKSIYQAAIDIGILPTKRVRWCCKEFKESAGAGKVTLIGIRHAESSRRAARQEVEISEKKYSGDLEGLEVYRKARNAQKRGRKPKNNREVTIVNADGERTLGCIRGKESLLISPIIEWTDDDVWNFLNTLGVAHCELYDQGWHRIGCIGCPMSPAKQKIVENKRWPHVKRNWIKAIKSIRAIPTVGGGELSEIRIQEKSFQRNGFKHPLNSYQKDIWRAIPQERMERNVERNNRVFRWLLFWPLDRGARKRNSGKHLRLVDFKQAIQTMVCREIPTAGFIR